MPEPAPPSADPKPQMGNTPLMRQYFDAKSERPGILLLMRVGDFYEAYGPDAELLASLLNITLTARGDGGERIAMAGVPYHAVERYIARLVKAGQRVAIMEQLEDPKLAKGLVERGVTRVLSRGTVLEDSLLDSTANNYLVCAVWRDAVTGIAVADISTGDFLVTELDGELREPAVIDELIRLHPTELLMDDSNSERRERISQTVSRGTGCSLAPLPERSLTNERAARESLSAHFETASLRGFGCDGFSAALEAAAHVLAYVRSLHAASSGMLTGLAVYDAGDRLRLDPVARRNLELTEPMGEGGRARSLLGVIDSTRTAMGARLLRRRIEQPLMRVEEINHRLDAVEAMTRSEQSRADLLALLKGVQDIERLVARASAGMASPRDLAAIRRSLDQLEPIAKAIPPGSADLLRSVAVTLHDAHAVPLPDMVCEGLPQITPAELRALLHRALSDEPPATMRDPGIVREGYDIELDALRNGAVEGREWMAGLESRERIETGIPSLKVGYNGVFGYYIEITKAHAAKTPSHYTRKQTLANAERYITQELKEWEAKVLGADERSREREAVIFLDLRSAVTECAPALLAVARAVAELDVTCGLAETAVRRRYVRPTVDSGNELRITAGRHPVVEALAGNDSFVPNDCRLDTDQNRMHVITGPNMAGKSTVLRQTALIVLLAQMGSFVPAKAAHVGVVDRIFTRVGAHDDLAMGQSTFMIEMTETAAILHNATPRSLVILDEIGRGTSTYDGLSIAWAVAERLLAIGCRTLFATHYHYLNDLARRESGVCNYRVAVRETGDKVVFLHKLIPGGTDRSFGVQVARMAGVPAEVINRAKEILGGLEKLGGSGMHVGAAPPPVERKVQLTLFEAEPHPVLEELKAVDISTLSPVEALVMLEGLQRKLKE